MKDFGELRDLLFRGSSCASAPYNDTGCNCRYRCPLSIISSNSPPWSRTSQLALPTRSGTPFSMATRIARATRSVATSGAKNNPDLLSKSSGLRPTAPALMTCRHQHPSPRRPTRNQRHWQLRRHTKLDRLKRSVRLRRLSRLERPGHLQRLLGQSTRHLRRRSLRVGLQCYAWWPGQHDVHCPSHLSGLSGR